MAIDEETTAEHSLGLLDQPSQRLVIGKIKALDAPPCLSEPQLFCIDLLPARDDPGNGAETHSDPRRAGVDETRQRVGEHCGVELVGLSVDVDIGAREAGREKRRTETRGGGEKLIDKAVLGLPQS